MRYTLHLDERTYEVATPVLGRHGVHNALAAVTVADRAGMDIADIITGLARPLQMPHRSQLVTAGPWTVLDDSYNASPDAVLAALDLLSELPGRHIAVLGEMLELGETAEREHRRVGAHAAGVVDELVVVGSGAGGIADGAIEAGLDAAHVVAIADRDEALATLLGRLQDGDSVLVKASRGAALDLLVERLVLAAGAGEAEA